MKLNYETMQPVISMQDITKEFSGVKALNHITFDAYPAEVHCLVGENGAGKSTLMKVLSGAYSPTSGKIRIEGTDYTSLTPKLSQSLGVPAQLLWQRIPGVSPELAAELAASETRS